MRPVRFSDLGTEKFKDSLHLFDMSRLGEHFLSLLILRDPNNVRSKSGNLALPLELWIMIMEELRAGPPRTGNYCLVRAFPDPLPVTTDTDDDDDDDDDDEDDEDDDDQDNDKRKKKNKNLKQRKDKLNVPHLIRCEKYLFFPTDWRAGNIRSGKHQDAFDRWLQNPDKGGSIIDDDDNNDNDGYDDYDDDGATSTTSTSTDQTTSTTSTTAANTTGATPETIHEGGEFLQSNSCWGNVPNLPELLRLPELPELKRPSEMPEEEGEASSWQESQGQEQEQEQGQEREEEQEQDADQNPNQIRAGIHKDIHKGTREDRVFHVRVAQGGYADKIIIPCLMVQVESVDVIAFMEGGKCRLCNSTRFLHRGQGLYKTKLYGIYFVCPLCMARGVEKLQRVVLIRRKRSWGKRKRENSGVVDMVTPKMERILQLGLERFGYQPAQVFPRFTV